MRHPQLTSHCRDLETMLILAKFPILRQMQASRCGDLDRLSQNQLLKHILGIIGNFGNAIPKM